MTNQLQLAIDVMDRFLSRYTTSAWDDYRSLLTTIKGDILAVAAIDTFGAICNLTTRRGLNIMAENRYSPMGAQKNNVDWQQQDDGSWNAVTAHYKLVAYKKDNETMENVSDGMKKYTHQSLLYKWNDEESVWVLIEKTIFGLESMEEARLSAERLLGNVLRPKLPPSPLDAMYGPPPFPTGPRSSGPEDALFAALIAAMMKGKKDTD